MRLTVGPLPPAVYWRRRAIVLGAALVVLFVVAQACMSGSPADDQSGGGGPSPGASTASPGGNQPAAAPPSTPPATGQPAGQPTGEGEGEDPGEDSEPPDESLCTDDEIEVTALAGDTEFAIGEQVRFTIRIAHDATRPCDRDVGGGQRELYLVPDPGSGRVWSSRDCADPRGEDVQQLTAGWAMDRHIDFLGNGGRLCDTRLEAGTYKLFARLGTAKGDPVEITLQ